MSGMGSRNKRDGQLLNSSMIIIYNKRSHLVFSEYPANAGLFSRADDRISCLPLHVKTCLLSPGMKK